MECFICTTCGMQYASAAMPPDTCDICTDERQYVGWEGQRWTTPDALRSAHAIRVADDAGVLSLDIAPTFAIPQRSAWLPTRGIHILWESLSLVTDEAVRALKDRGGVDLIAISHPHFYTAMVDWSEALGGVPILLHEADRAWVRRPSPRIDFWRGDALDLSEDAALLRLGGHFPGSTGLHWRSGPTGRGALFPGDAMQVVADRRYATFMYSYPNFIPMRPADVRAMHARLERLGFDDVYGYSRGRNILRNGRAAIDASFDRYFDAIDPSAPGRA